MSGLIFDLQKMIIFYLDITEYTKQERNELLMNVFEIKRDKIITIVNDWYRKYSKHQNVRYESITWHYVNDKRTYTKFSDWGSCHLDIIPTNNPPF